MSTIFQEPLQPFRIILCICADQQDNMVFTSIMSKNRIINYVEVGKQVLEMGKCILHVSKNLCSCNCS